LIAGDLLFVAGGLLLAAPQFINHDSAAELRSLEKLTRFDIQSVICYHGGLYRDNPKRCLAELANNVRITK
jgi:glyoxylase-like metal-dependent hydrolase (beta-lactamase superfamily II)